MQLKEYISQNNKCPACQNGMCPIPPYDEMMECYGDESPKCPNKYLVENFLNYYNGEIL